MTYINTESISEQYRRRAVDALQKRLLVSNFRDSEQEQDLTDPPNCDGLGRIRHFRRATSPGWVPNPLPIDPANERLGCGPSGTIRAQVFQNAICNWRCWYCFVPFDLLSANKKHSAWVSAGELMDLYLQEPDRPKVIDLTGGQPDLVPEWVPWMMRELLERGLDKQVYLWSDDNLSTDYFWRFLSDEDRALVASYENYGRVCCFKGFDDLSFSFNTKADPALFDRQFELMGRLLATGIDIYAYATFTTPSPEDINAKIAHFVDRLQSIHPNLPLRTVPLEVQVFSPVVGRMNGAREESLGLQWKAMEAWKRELARRFSEEELGQTISQVRIT